MPSYDIAINKQSDSSYGLTAYLWEGHLENQIGQGYGKLLQLYGVHKTLIKRKQQTDGSINLIIAAGV